MSNKTENLDSQLLDAANNGQLDKVISLVGQGADVNAKDKDGVTALMFAAREGCLDIVEFLVEKDADMNAKDKDDWTALMFAAYEGLLNNVKYLIRNGANVDARSKNGEAAIDFAIRMSHPKTTSFLRRYKEAVENKTEKEFWEEEDSRSGSDY